MGHVSQIPEDTFSRKKKENDNYDHNWLKKGVGPLKKSVPSKWADKKTFGGTIYFAVEVRSCIPCIGICVWNVCMAYVYEIVFLLTQSYYLINRKIL